eukprot:1142716-Pelagomonas_calceolata.AAC.2
MLLFCIINLFTDAAQKYAYKSLAGQQLIGDPQWQMTSVDNAGLQRALSLLRRAVHSLDAGVWGAGAGDEGCEGRLRGTGVVNSTYGPHEQGILRPSNPTYILVYGGVLVSLLLLGTRVQPGEQRRGLVLIGPPGNGNTYFIIW